MILDDDSLNVLRKWLIKHLEPLSDAEPYVLANYVLALLRNDKSRPELRDLCTSELEDFLKDETKQFVAKLFDVLTDVENKRYDNLLEEHEHEQDDTDRDHKHARRETPPPEGEEERGKRDEDDRRDGGEHKRRRDDDLSDEDRGRYDKRYTRERQDNNYDRDRGRQQRRYEDYDKRGQRPYGRGNDGGDRGRRYQGGPYNNRDQRNGGPIGNQNIPQQHQQQQQQQQQGGRQRLQRCRDYDEKGYCMRGDLCPYEHGNPVIVSDVQELQKMNIVEPQPVFQDEGYIPKRPRYENQEAPAMYEQEMGYNPENPVFGVQQNFDRRRRVPPRNKLVGVPEDSIALQTIPLVPSSFQPHMMHQGGVGGATTAAGDKRRIVFDPTSADNTEYNKRPQRFPQNNNNDSNSIVLHPTVNLNPNAQHHAQHQPHAQHQQHQFHHGGAHGAHGSQQNFKDNSTLLITNIPPDLNTIDQLNSHFKKFGNLVNIQVKSQANKSYVQFSNHQEALRALRSVEAVLGNRFIKVFWSTSPSDILPSPAAPPSTTSAPSSIPTLTSAPLSSSPPSSASLSLPSAPSQALSTSLSASFASHNRVFSTTPSIAGAATQDIKMEEKTVKPTLSAPLAQPRTLARTPSDAEREKKEKLLALQKKKDELRQQQITNQKQMLEMMTKRLKAGNLSQAEKEDLLKTMKAATDTLQELLQKESAHLQKQQQLQQQGGIKAAVVTGGVKDIKEVIKKKEKDRLDRELESIARSSSAPSLSSSSSSSSTPLTSSSDTLTMPPATTPTPSVSSPLPSTTTSTSSSTPSSSSPPPPSVPTALSSPPTLKTSAETPPSTALQHLQSIKQNLEQQALLMGLDPSSLHKIPTTMGGRGRGRGRGGMGGRGRGRGGAGGGGLSLDNRPTSLLISNLPDDTNEAALRAHFLQFGELSSVEFPSPSMAVIQFADRFRAESALTGGKQFKGQKLQMSWYNPTLKATSSSSSQTQENKTSAQDTEKDQTKEGETIELSSSTASLDQESSEPYGHFDEEEEETERSWKH